MRRPPRSAVSGTGEEFQALLDAVLDPAVVVEPVHSDGRLQDFVVTLANARVAEEAGALATVVGRSVGDVVPECLPEQELAMALAGVVARGEAFEHEGRRWLGHEEANRRRMEACDLRAVPFGERCVVVWRRVPGPDALRAAEAEARLAANERLAGVGSWEWEAATDRLTWSDGFNRIYTGQDGTAAERTAKARELVRVPGSPGEGELQSLYELLEGFYSLGRPFRVERDIVRSDGVIRRIELRGEPVLGEDGVPVGLRGTGQDLSELRRVEEERAGARELLSRRESELVAEHSQRLNRWARLTEQLLEILSDRRGEDPIDRLLETLGTELGCDVTTMWSISTDGSLFCRNAWTEPHRPATRLVEEKRNPMMVARHGLPPAVVAAGRPLWVSDVATDPRFSSGTAASEGLVTAFGFPVRYRGDIVGVVEVLSRKAQPFDPHLSELLEIVAGNLGELIFALEHAAERERLMTDLQATRARHEFLLRASKVLAEATDLAQTIARLAEVAVPVLADLCLIDLVDEEGRLERLAAHHADPAVAPLVAALRDEYPPDVQGPHPAMEVLRTGVSRWSAHMSAAFLRETTHDERHYEIVNALSFTSYMAVPLKVEERVLGTVTLISAGSGRRFGESDLALAEELASQVAAVVERARSHEREHRISHTLQHSLLPDRLPEVPGLEVAARYVPASDLVEVGGDWYDAVPLGDGRLAFVVGDVEGHDMRAASTMGRLRHALWAYLLDGLAPDLALAKLNSFALAAGVDRIATVVLVVLDPATGRLDASSAGHPPPVRSGGGVAALLPLQPGPPIGVPGARYTAWHGGLPEGGLLIAYSDGLVERRRDDLSDRLGRLVELAGPLGGDSETVADRLLDGLFEPSGIDDVALLVVRRGQRSAK